MFFKVLFKNRRGAFWLLVLACLLQWLVFYKQGAVATPFFNYGMYSGVIKPEKSYDVIKVYVNGKLLKAEDFSIQEWDKVYVPIYMFRGKDSANAFAMDIQTRFFSKIGIFPFPEQHYLFTCSTFDEKAFLNWYRLYLSALIGSQVEDFKIVKQNYVWDGHLLQPGDSTQMFR